MVRGLARHSIVSNGDRGIGNGGSTARTSAAGDEQTILRIIHQRRNVLALAYVGGIDD